MNKLFNSEQYKIKYLFLLLIKLYIIFRKKYLIDIKAENSYISSNLYEIKTFYDLLNITINNNTILIIETRSCHYECTPGYTKYFFELGYNVDIIMHFSGIESFCMFKGNQKIRLFTYKDQCQIYDYSKNLSHIIKRYEYILLQSTNKNQKSLYDKLELLNISNSIFVFHEIGYSDINFSKFFYQNRIWTLGNISNAIQVNPHYFGDIKIRNKNKKTKFFITSTVNRNYKPLLDSVNKLKSENYNFEIY